MGLDAEGGLCPVPAQGTPEGLSRYPGALGGGRERSGAGSTPAAGTASSDCPGRGSDTWAVWLCFPARRREGTAQGASVTVPASSMATPWEMDSM